MDKKTIRWNTTKLHDTNTTVLVNITLLLLVNIQFLVLIHRVEMKEQFIQTGLICTIDSNVTSLEFILSNDNRKSIDKSLYNPVLTFNGESLTDLYYSCAVLFFKVFVFWKKTSVLSFKLLSAIMYAKGGSRYEYFCLD